MDNYINWDLKCPDCGFEFSIGFPIDETEENKKELRSCPCGSEMDILRERKLDNDRQRKVD